MTESEDRFHPKYLKWRYGEKFQVVKGQDGIWVLPTRFKPSPEGLDYDIHVHGDGGLLGILLPRGRALYLLRTHPGDFTMRQDACDGIALTFGEENLGRFVKVLRLKKRRKLSPETRAKVILNLIQNQKKQRQEEGFRLQNRRSRARSC